MAAAGLGGSAASRSMILSVDGSLCAADAPNASSRSICLGNVGELAKGPGPMAMPATELGVADGDRFSGIPVTAICRPEADGLRASARGFYTLDGEARRSRRAVRAERHPGRPHRGRGHGPRRSRPPGPDRRPAAGRAGDRERPAGRIASSAARTGLAARSSATPLHVGVPRRPLSWRRWTRRKDDTRGFARRLSGPGRDRRDATGCRPAHVEDMYKPNFRAWTEPGEVKITPAE